MEQHIAKIKQRLIRLQNVIYATLLAAGIVLLGTTLAGIHYAPAEAIAFITVGCVGLIMSLTTFDVATGIKEEIRAVGDKLSVTLEKMSSTLDEISATQKAMAATLVSISAKQDEILDVTRETLSVSKETLRVTRETLSVSKETLQAVRDKQ